MTRKKSDNNNILGVLQYKGYKLEKIHDLSLWRCKVKAVAIVEMLISSKIAKKVQAFISLFKPSIQ